MSVEWNDVQKALLPIKSYQDLCLRWQESLGYMVVRTAYNFSVSELVEYTHRCLGGDTRSRYAEYEAMLVRILNEMDRVGVQNILYLAEKIAVLDGFEHLTDQSGLSAHEIAAALKYLTYWFIPINKPLHSLVRDDPVVLNAVKLLREMGIRSNLDLLERGNTPAGRQALVKDSGLPGIVVLELVNRADFSRLPWASKATISNIIGAGYGSLAQLAGADPQQLFQDFYRYGQSIGKNLKLGNEIDNSQRIAKLIPVIFQEESM